MKSRKWDILGQLLAVGTVTSSGGQSQATGTYETLRHFFWSEGVFKNSYHPPNNHKGFVNKFSFRLILGYRPESLAGFPLDNLGHDAQGALRGHEKSIACDWKRVGTITCDKPVYTVNLLIHERPMYLIHSI